MMSYCAVSWLSSRLVYVLLILTPVFNRFLFVTVSAESLLVLTLEMFLSIVDFKSVSLIYFEVQKRAKSNLELIACLGRIWRV